jgi:hypothetical protein
MNIAATIPDGRDRAPARRAKILELKNVFVGELAQHGAWVVANISTSSHWPIAAQKVRWRGTDLWIIPITKSTYPAVAMRVPSWMGRAACEELVMRFVSMLSWVEERGFMVDGIGGGSLPRPMGRNEEQGFAICEEFDLSYFPEVTDDRASLALALMREGRSINHPGYAFLSFYRVLEVAFPAGKQGIIDDLGGDRPPDGLRHQGSPRRYSIAGHHDGRGYRLASVPVRSLRDGARQP